MNRKQLVNAIIAVIVIAGLLIAGVAAWYLIRQPDKVVTLDKVQSEKMWTLLKEANYVSPNYPSANDPNRAIFLITYKGCDACLAYQRSEFGKFHAKGIEPRVYTFSPAVGQSRIDSATIVQVWLSRDWNLYNAWANDPAWNGKAVPPADDMARKYVFKATQDFYASVIALMPVKNPADLHAPIVMWAGKDNLIKVCFCDNALAYHNVSDDFGITGASSISLPNIQLPPALNFGGQSSSSSSSSSSSAAPAPAASSASSSSRDGERPSEFGPDT